MTFVLVPGKPANCNAHLLEPDGEPVHRAVPGHGHRSQSHSHACFSHIVSAFCPFSTKLLKQVEMGWKCENVSAFLESASRYQPPPTSSWLRSGWSSPWFIPLLRPCLSASKICTSPRLFWWKVTIFIFWVHWREAVKMNCTARLLPEIHIMIL